ncbi:MULTISPECIES: co-chaperone HscB [Corallincola]|uniref:Co-chaperone protein HscB homolog n=3 Tax=Corallincola TaxID=1775176 RepID=A0A368NDS5_9GAMM|nr:MULTISPECIES: co-chaperone HscB [Corallincola]RCU48787.1 co-chaperone HscB [Corallincola holothuriorum]TAA42684.1 co-chaperone HscB [Corallincola spongiicola]TCI01665.1 co-chaperone HscB [Corallincola luteus]
MDYFELFDLPHRFDVKSAQLSETFRKLQSAVHPDRFGAASEQDKRIALQRSAHINDAYQTLKHPLSRAVYMLSTAGHDLKSEQKSFSDTAFLMQQMEFREQLDDIKANQDMDSLLAMQSDVDAEITRYLARIGEALDAPAKGDYADVADEVRRLKFFYKLNDELAELEDALIDF